MERKKFKLGLAVMRAQPLHIGHQKLINRMLKDCENIIIILGSVQEQGTDRNPYTYIQRKQMILKVFDNVKEQITVLGMFDINNSTQWACFVLDFLKESLPHMPTPDVYYAGSAYDAQWFENAISKIVIEDRVDYNFPYVSGSMVRDMIKIGDLRWKQFVPNEIHDVIEGTPNATKGIF